MRLLVLGGTAFLGRAVVDAALARGDAVTTFNRGTSGPDRDSVEAVHGDRTVPADLDQLRGREWDAVVDTAGQVPAVVGESARLLAGAVGRYAFVSSVSVYRDWPKVAVDEGSPVHAGRADAGRDDGDYGELKVGCELAVRAAVGDDRALLIRPGLILGPWENVGRLPWWLLRMARGGEVLAPGDPDVAVQVVDVRDLAAFTLRALDLGASGPVNVTGPAGQISLGDWLAACARATGSDARLTWVPDDHLLAHGIEPWTELPLWMPLSDAEVAHTWQVDVTRALELGLVARDPRDTIADTWAWLRARDLRPNAPVDDEGRVRGHGITPAKEAGVLAGA